MSSISLKQERFKRVVRYHSMLHDDQGPGVHPTKSSYD